MIRAVLTLQQFGHIAREPVAGEVGGGALGLLAGGGRAVSAIGPPVISYADFSMHLGIAERGVSHCPDEYQDKGNTCNDRPLGFGLGHDFMLPRRNFPFCGTYRNAAARLHRA